MRLKIKKDWPVLPMKAGKTAFKTPLGYGKVGEVHNKYAYEYYLFPFYLFIRLVRAIQRWQRGKW